MAFRPHASRVVERFNQNLCKNFENTDIIVLVEMSEKPSSARFLGSFSDFWFVGP